jgi:hypothetical protein
VLEVIDEEQNELTGSYSFDELSDKAKQTARNKAREWVDNDEWWDYTYEDAVRIGELLGITIKQRDVQTHGGGTRSEPCIAFSLAFCQGDGAAFNGSYKCMPDAIQKVQAEAPEDEVLLRIANDLTALQMQLKLTCFDTVECVVSTQGNRECHSGAMYIDWVQWSEGDEPCDEDLDNDLLSSMRAFADWIFAQLRAEYEYRTSDEASTRCCRTTISSTATAP